MTIEQYVSQAAALLLASHSKTTNDLVLLLTDIDKPYSQPRAQCAVTWFAKTAAQWLAS